MQTCAERTWDSRSVTKYTVVYIKLLNQFPSGIALPLSGLSSLSFLNSSLPNFQVKLIPKERNGICRKLLIVKLGPNKVVRCFTYSLNGLVAVRARLAFLFQNRFRKSKLSMVNDRHLP